LQHSGETEKLRAVGAMNALIQLNPYATHCNALQRAATHCNALQRTATHCNTILQHAATQLAKLKN